MNRITRMAIASILAFITVVTANAQTMSSGWYWPTEQGNSVLFGWLQQNPNFGNKYHLAIDLRNNANRPVYSIGDGVILYSEEHNGYGCNGDCKGGTVLARYQAADGTWFTVLYGHLDNYRGTGTVSAQEVIGYSLPDWNPPHLHFAVHPGYDPVSNWYAGYTPSTSQLYGFTDPLPFLNAHPRTVVDPCAGLDLNNLYVQFGWGSNDCGTAANPLNSLQTAIGKVNGGGTININNSGSAGGTLNPIGKTVTLRPTGGPVTLTP